MRNLFDTYREVSRKNLLEAYHDAIEYRDECLTLFALGHLSLEQRGLAEDLFWAICQKILNITRNLHEIPEELEGLERALADTYFCNFSMFQSLPDSWAIDQLFPIMPIHRLNEEPQPRRARRHHLRLGRQDRPLHRPPRRQGRARAALPAPATTTTSASSWSGPTRRSWATCTTCSATPTRCTSRSHRDGGYQIDHVVSGDTVTDVLHYVSYNRDDLVAQVRQAAEVALRAKRMTLEESRHLLRIYEEGLSGYTYLEQELRGRTQCRTSPPWRPAHRAGSARQWA